MPFSVYRSNLCQLLFALLTVVFFAKPAIALPLLVFPSANDLAGPVFVQPFAGLEVVSVVGGIGTTEPFFSDLPDGAFLPNNLVVNLAGNFQAFDEFGAPTTAFNIAGVAVSNNFVNFFTPAFGQFNFAGMPSVTFRDSLNFNQVTFFAIDPTLAFTFTANPNLSYEYRLLTTGLGVGSFVVFDDAETTIRIPEPSSLWLLGLGLIGLCISRRRFLPLAALLLAFSGSLFAAPTLTRVSQPIGQAGDVIVITGTGFSASPAQNDLRFGPNRAAVRAATPTQLTVAIPNGQPLGPTRITVDSSNSLSFITTIRSKVVTPLNPATEFEDYGNEPYQVCFGCRRPRIRPSPVLPGPKADSIYIGEFFQPAVDLFIRGRPGAAAALDYRFRRQYRSAGGNSGALGNNWDHSYFERLEVEPDGSVIDHNGLGRNDRYLVNNLGQLVAPPEFYTQLTKNLDGSYTLRYLDGTIKKFDSNGKITQIADRNGNALSFSYNSQNQLQTVVDTLGRPITYTYDISGRLRQVTDFIGRSVTYTYDVDGNLTSVTSPAVTGTPNGNDFPAGKTTRYTYDSNHRLLTITRPNEVASGGPPVLTNVYDSSGKVITQIYGGTNASGVPAGGTFTFSYTALNAGVTSDDPNLPVMRTQQTDPNGNVAQLDYNRLGYVVVMREFTRGIRPTDPSVYIMTMTYNADGRLIQNTMPAGNATQYAYNEGNADRLQQGNLLSETDLRDAARGGDQSFIITSYTYEPIYNDIATMIEPRGDDPSYVPQNGGAQSAARYTTMYTYDATGNLTKEQRPTVTLPGGRGLQTVVTDYTYNAFGQLTSETDPEGNVTLYLFCPTATPNCSTPDPNGGGYLQRKIVDATTSPRRIEAAPPAAINTQYFYDAQGYLIRTIDGRGNDTLFTVNQLHQVVETQSEAPFRYTTYTYYDANENVVRKDNENKVAITIDGKPNFTGDGNFITADGTPAFFTSRYTYDILDKMVTDDEDATGSIPSRLITQYRYDPNQNRIQEILPVGNITQSQYDERNLLFTKTLGFGNADASTTTYGYDVNGNLLQEMDGRGNPTIYKYDGFDRRTAISDAVGGQSITHYDPASNVISKSRFGQPGGPSPTDNSGAGNVLLRAQTYQVDELSRVFQDDDQPINGSSFVASGVSTVRPASVVPGPLNAGTISTQLIYDRNSRVVQRIKDDLATTLIQYDGVDRETVRTDPQGNIATILYDANGNEVAEARTEFSQKAGVANETFATTYQYDSHNRSTSDSDNCQNTRRSAFDSRNNVTHMTDAKADDTLGCPGTQNAQGNSMRCTYDGMSREIQTTEDLRMGGVGLRPLDMSNPFIPSGQVITRFAYDANGRLTSVTDSNGDTTQYFYDALDRQSAETLADGTKTTYTYDANSNVVTLTDNNGTVQAHIYDAINRRTQTSVTPAAFVIGTTINTYQYDGLFRATRMTDNNDPADTASASTLTFAYDSLGRVVEETQNGRAVDSAWFAQAQRTALTYPNNRQLNFAYDSLERIQSIKDNGAPTAIALYTYIGPERMLERDYQNCTRLTFLDNAGTTDIGYDSVKRVMVHRDLRCDDSLVIGFTYAYDREDNKSYEEKLHSTASSELYTYDSAYRITDFARGQLNAVGNAIVLPPSIVAPATRTEDWTLDGVGNWRVDTVNGNPISFVPNQTNEYIQINGGQLLYNNNGNLVSDGVLGYQWDYKNRLRQVCTLPAPTSNCTSSGAVLLATYSYDAMDRRTRKVVTNSGSLNGTTNFYYHDWRVLEEHNGSDVLTQQYVYGIYLDEPVVLDRSGQRLFYHQNTLSSTFALTDTSGNVVEGYQYNAYGEQTVFGPGFGSPIGSVSAVGNPYTFTGQRFDPETGLLYYKHHYYSPRLGRFINRDSLGYVDSHNLFEYAGDSPTKHAAPLGLR